MGLEERIKPPLEVEVSSSPSEPPHLQRFTPIINHPKLTPHQFLTNCNPTPSKQLIHSTRPSNFVGPSNFFLYNLALQSPLRESGPPSAHAHAHARGPFKRVRPQVPSLIFRALGPSKCAPSPRQPHGELFGSEFVDLKSTALLLSPEFVVVSFFFLGKVFLPRDGEPPQRSELAPGFRGPLAAQQLPRLPLLLPQQPHGRPPLQTHRPVRTRRQRLLRRIRRGIDVGRVSGGPAACGDGQEAEGAHSVRSEPLGDPASAPHVGPGTEEDPRKPAADRGQLPLPGEHRQEGLPPLRSTTKGAMERDWIVREKSGQS